MHGVRKGFCAGDLDYDGVGVERLDFRWGMLVAGGWRGEDEEEGSEEGAEGEGFLIGVVGGLRREEGREVG